MVSCQFYFGIELLVATCRVYALLVFVVICDVLYVCRACTLLALLEAVVEVGVVVGGSGGGVIDAGVHTGGAVSLLYRSTKTIGGTDRRTAFFFNCRLISLRLISDVCAAVSCLGRFLLRRETSGSLRTHYQTIVQHDGHHDAQDSQ